jgi:L-lactate dehydrogenase complex protein LldF
MGLEKTAQLPYASSLCGACREVCPVKIDIPRLLLHLRGEITEKPPAEVSHAKSRKGERLAFKLWAKVMTRPWLYEKSASLGRLFQRFVVRKGIIGRLETAGRLVPPLGAWTSGRDLRPIEQQTFRQRWRNDLSSKNNE